MKYGSSVKIEVRELWGNTPLFSAQLTISNNPASRAALEEIKRELSKWFNTTVKAVNLGKDLSDADVLLLAKSRGLITDEKDEVASDLYFIPSRSNKTNGHYIERFRSGTVTCSCPGFFNNGKCWASTSVKTSPDQNLGNKWVATREVFKIYRKNDYPTNEY
jgi:hypothetical protein